MSKEIKKVLIANRAEIALRVIKTCKKMGIKTVCIYSKEDMNSPHRYKADESFYLGEGALSETYLNIDKIIQIAKDCGADAIHPGYGFLSENTNFARALDKNGIIFIGPSVSAIELMGDKTTSKVAMEKIGIPLIPGYHGDNQEEGFLYDKALEIGFPVLIKASAGGGGKGMKIVKAKEDFKEALASAKREGLKSFSNDNVLLEKYIENPKHIEVQLVSDGKDNHFHFWERECSAQRRYQKVVEETPSPSLDQDLREKICETAVKIAAGINYVGAGTIEYILAPDNNYYFLEMNTRLQVEHPVTEMVTGFDLVELQIKAAMGLAFDFSQADIPQTGHSIEVRIYAEDPDNNFLPTIGTIEKIGSCAHARLDCGFRDGNIVSTSFDPMLAKLIVHENNRDAARNSLSKALNEVTFSGIKTNRDYLKRILNHRRFITADLYTNTLEKNADEFEKEALRDVDIAKAAAILVHMNGPKVKTSWDNLYNFRNV
ncbi:MAG: ATP-grasp domain-containing protein [Bacteriovoracaceae bacterium]|jgi:3-methylcrotonyl-CoA carboxylase alpha subunit|nr:ATP-grasp domain-containing protein [Bacteriovoracaceae bacterium]